VVGTTRPRPRVTVAIGPVGSDSRNPKFELETLSRDAPYYPSNHWKAINLYPGRVEHVAALKKQSD